MTRSARSELNRSVAEDDLLTTILEAAALFGWLRFHIRRSDKALQQGDAGFPDLVLARHGVVIMAELKREGENLTQAQYAWSRELPADSFALRYRIWRPADLDAAIEELRG